MVRQLHPRVATIPSMRLFRWITTSSPPYVPRRRTAPAKTSFIFEAHDDPSQNIVELKRLLQEARSEIEDLKSKLSSLDDVVCF